MKRHRRKYQFYIGIDTGVNTGWAVWVPKDKRFLDIRTTPVHTAMLWAGTWASMTDETGATAAFFVVEDARKAKHGRQEDGYKMRGAGSVMRDAKFWEDYLNSIGADFEMVRPNPAITKLAAGKFEKTTGWTDKTSSHGRDAAMLVYGY